MIGFAAAVAVLLSAVTLVANKLILHTYQLEGYSFHRVKAYFSPSITRRYAAYVLSCVPLEGLWLALYLSQTRTFWYFLIAVAGAAAWIIIGTSAQKKAKKPLVLTKRVFRLCLTQCIVVFGACAATVVSSGGSPDSFTYLACFAAPLVSPVIFFISAYAVKPLEALIRGGYKLRAKMRLRAFPGLKIIAVTGSYGKTSVKNAIKPLLESRYNVLATPASYNTPMGIARSVEGLTAEHGVFVAEFGARHRQDIRELCRLLPPSVGVITAVCGQHLETFKTLENVLETKLDLARALPSDGLLVYGSDCVVLDERIAQLCKTGEIKCRTAAIGVNVGTVEHITVDRNGTSFLLNVGKLTEALGIPSGSTEMREEALPLSTKLIGAHHAVNVAMAACVALALGVSSKEIGSAVSELPFVEHRLEPIEGNGVLILDDSFNGNPIGAKAAIDAIACLPGRKVVLTCGLVELGEAEESANFELGKQISEVASVVLLIGKQRTEPIVRGLVEGGFSGVLKRFDSLAEAQENFRFILKTGDVLLIENDLPDNYD